MVPRISPLAARSRLTARATDAKIRLWRIKHRRVQTAAVGLCRGVYVFVGRVLLRIMLRRVQTAVVGLCRGVYVFVGRVEIGLGDLGGAVSQAEREISFSVSARWCKKKPPYRLQRIVRYDGSVIIIII